MAAFDHYKPFVSIGVMGDVKHGRKELTAAITKVLTLRGKPQRGRYGPPEDRLRGPRIKIWDIEYETDTRRYGYYGIHSYHDCIKNVIAGLGNRNGAILVVSAPDGLLPETHEQVRLARQIEVPALVVFLDDVDRVDDPERLKGIEMEIAELMESGGFAANSPIVHGSALLANASDSTDINAPEYQPILKLMDALDVWIPSPTPDFEKPFLMPIEDVFSLKERGTVATGRIERGKLAKGDEVEIVGLRAKPFKSAVSSIEMFRKELDAVIAGDSVGIFLRNTPREDVERGMVLAKPGSIMPHRKFICQVYILKKEEGGRGKSFFSGYSPQFYIRTIYISGTITMPENMEMVMPGDIVNLQVELTTLLALEKGWRFAIREGKQTIGAGIITEILD